MDSDGSFRVYYAETLPLIPGFIFSIFGMSETRNCNEGKFNGDTGEAIDDNAIEILNKLYS